MKRFRASYKKIRRKYLAQRASFKRRIAYWQRKGMLDYYQRGKQLMQDADDHIDVVNAMLPQQQTGTEKALMRRKIRRFKEIYKELHESTKPLWRQWGEAIIVAAVLAFCLRTFVFGLYHVPTGSAERNILVGDRIFGNKFHYFFNDVKRGELVIFDHPNFSYDTSNPVNYYWQKYVGFPLPLIGLGSGPENWVKRVIAVPGDTIEGRIENGKTTIYRNGEKIDEPYINPYPLIRVRKTTGFINLDSLGPFKVPSFLRKQAHLRIYTFDPSLPLDEQEYYRLTSDEIIRDMRTGEYMFEYPYTPNSDRVGGSYDSFGPFVVPEGKLWVQGDSRKNSIDSRYWGFLDQSLIHGRASFILYSIDSEEPLWLFEFLKNPVRFFTTYFRWRRSFRWIS